MPDNTFLAYSLIGLALLLLAAELFIPTFGVLFVLGLGGLIVGVAMTFQESIPRGIITLVALFVIVPIFGNLLLRYWPKTRLGKKFFLPGPEEDQTLAIMPTHLELEQLRGRYGRTVSALRPAGITDFDGKRVDTMSEGNMIDHGRWVRCIDVKAGKVIVRQVDKPPDLTSLETTELG